MFSDEIEMTLECAVKVRRHLLRTLEKRNESCLEEKLHYVNEIIQEAGYMHGESSPYA